MSVTALYAQTDNNPKQVNLEIKKEMKKNPRHHKKEKREVKKETTKAIKSEVLK
jgi:hypothetical protein